ncbi:MAG: class I SAM-dependent methyltransferase [Gemmatimonadaceae bacterium]
MTERQHPAPANARIFTPDYYARMRELEATSWWNEAMRDIAGMLIDRARIPSSGIFVDAGCASGQTMNWFVRRHPGWRGIGFDIAADGLEFAHKTGLRVSQATALSVPLRNNSVDLVISCDTLQHLPLDGGDASALREFFRVLRPGGALLLRTNAQSFPRAREDKEFSFRKYDPRSLRAKLFDAGFLTRVLGRCNAVLGLAEIPRELRAARTASGDYHGILAQPGGSLSVLDGLKKAWLRFEGRAVLAGLSLPLGRTLVVLAEKPR